MPRPLFTVLKVAKETDIPDLKATLANKMQGPYLYTISSYGGIEIAVVKASDVEQVLAAFDVIDRHYAASFDGRSIYDFAS